MTVVLVPVKLFSRAKQRLAPHCSQPARAALAEALCRDFFAVLRSVAAERILVVSAEPIALALARANDWEVIAETEQNSESDSVDAASRLYAARGVRAVLRLPVDLPLVQPEDIDALLGAAEPAPSCIVVPSADSTGTNALLRVPPDLFPSRFGPGSFARHLEEAERASARVKIVRKARIATDVDEIDDLRAIADRVAPDSALARWLEYNPLSCAGNTDRE
jgi:2-phospho-L-lactate/phosphoenolpyruvate guanylyltransferase